MKKMLKYTKWLCMATLVACATLLTGCDDDTLDGPVLPSEFALVIDQLNVAWNETEAVADFDANDKWKVVQTPEWVKIDPRSGKAGTHRMFFNISPNTYRTARTGEVLMTCGDKNGKITITQGACTDDSAIPATAFAGNIANLDGSTLELNFSEFAADIKGNLGMTLDEFAKGIDTDGALEFFMLDGTNWVKGGTAGTPCGAWLDSDLMVTTWNSAGYPANSVFIEAYPGEQPKLVIGHAPGVPDNTEFNLKFGFTLKNDHTRFIIFNGTVTVVPVSLKGTIVGNYTMDITVPPSDGYENILAPFNADEVAAKLGTTNLGRCKVVSYDSDGEFIAYTGNNGYWCNADGSIGKWGADAAWAVEYRGDESDTTAPEYGAWSLCPYPGVTSASGTTNVGLWYSGKVVMFKLQITVKGSTTPDPNPGDVTIVETRDLSVTLQPSDSYATTLAPFDAAAVASKLGAAKLTDCKVVCYDADKAVVKQSANNGYWYNKDGSVGKWGADAGWGIEYHGDAADTAAAAYSAWTLCPYPGVNGVSATSSIGFEYNGKAVMFNVNVTVAAASGAPRKRALRR